jgi:NAD(P)H-quinone oxidoreductase subunit 4L
MERPYRSQKSGDRRSRGGRGGKQVNYSFHSHKIKNRSNHQVQLEYFLLLAAALFCIGIYGLINSRNAVRVLMSIELMLNAVNLNLVGFSNFLDSSDIKGQVFTVFVITVAAAEAAVGLAIVLAIYRNRQTIDMEQFNLLKW